MLEESKKKTLFGEPKTGFVASRLVDVSSPSEERTVHRVLKLNNFFFVHIFFSFFSLFSPAHLWPSITQFLRRVHASQRCVCVRLIENFETPILLLLRWRLMMEYHHCWTERVLLSGICWTRPTAVQHYSKERRSGNHKKQEWKEWEINWKLNVFFSSSLLHRSELENLTRLFFFLVLCRRAFNKTATTSFCAFFSLAEPHHTRFT